MPSQTITITDEALKWLEAGAALTGRTVDALLQEIIAQEATRQFHLVRCQPKPSAPRTPVGRPRIDPAEHQRRELAAFLEAIYIKLRGMLGIADFDMVHGKDYEHLGKLLIAKDLEGLQAFSREQPWQKIRSGR